MTTTNKIHGIIHSASASAAAIGAGLAQLPGSDMPILCSLQTTMIIAIANIHGQSIDSSIARDLLVTYSAGYGGRALSQCLVGWIPAWGNTINASTAASITEAIGWSANAYFKK